MHRRIIVGDGGGVDDNHGCVYDNDNRLWWLR